ncbi:unnamed protein product [Angiostrongylus costaricensis]|uniref:Secreted protein n=1 Tax=Angiostrongylus costaricensis TaxID=334426 RepID=A0A0R3PL09_ANGCS|nr:unnamed protein product [Angiostrongylus costaricensis]
MRTILLLSAAMIMTRCRVLNVGTSTGCEDVQKTRKSELTKAEMKNCLGVSLRRDISSKTQVEQMGEYKKDYTTTNESLKAVFLHITQCFGPCSSE